MNRIGNYLATTALLAITLMACTQKRATTDNSLKKYFDDNKVEGCFTLLNNISGEITVYNMAMDTTRYTPASTFKIVNSLIGLQTGAITNDTMIIKWDGVKRSNEAWNKDLGMKDAFRASSVPYYQEVARRIGRDTMQKWMDSLRYGNRKTSGPIDSFWLNNQLKISPDEQLGLMKKLFFNQLPFRATVQESVKDAMLWESDTTYKLSYKTGWGFDEANNNLGWMVGWIEENRHVYFFVTLVKSADKNIDMRAVRMNITKGILTKMGFFKGEM